MDFRILDSVKSTSGKCLSEYLISSFSYKKYIGLKHTEYMHLSKWLYSSLIDKLKKYTPANRMQTWPQTDHNLYLIELITLKSSSQLFSQDGVKRLKSVIYL